MDKGKGLSIIIPNYRERRLMEVYGQCKLIFPEAQVILQDDLNAKGKGWAIREGVKKAKYDIICFIDGDLDIEPKEMEYLISWLPYYEAVIGKRIYNASFQRKICSYGYRLLIRILFGLTVDTQSGLKLFHKSTLPEWKTDSFAYDVEILAKMKQCDLFIKEIPIKCKITEGKSIKAVWVTFIETLRVWKRLQ